MTDIVEVSASALKEMAGSLRNYKTSVTTAGISAKNTQSFISECQWEIDKTGSELQNVRGELSMKRNDLDKFEGLRYCAEKDKKDAEYRLHKAEDDRYANMKASEKMEIEAKNAMKDMNFNESKARSAQTREEAAPFEYAVGQAQKRYNNAINQKKNYDSLVAVADKKINIAQGQINKLSKDIMYYEGQIYELNNQIQLLQDREYRLNDKLNGMKNAFSRLETDIQNYQNEVDRYISSTGIIADRLLNSTELCLKYIEEYESIRLI